MKKSRSTTAAALAPLLFPSWALAHPGHGHHDGDFSLVHYLTEPQHVLLIVGILAGGLLLVHLAVKTIRWAIAPKAMTSKPVEAKVRR